MGKGWANVTVDTDFSLAAERGEYSGYSFHALRFTSDGQGGEITLSQDGTALDLTGNGDLFETTNANQNGMNLYFDGTGTTTITGVKLDNSKQAGTSQNVTKTYYAFVVASGGVTFDGVKGEGDSSIDLQQNLSVGTAWTNYSETPAVLTIQGGSKIETTAYYNAVGSNGSKGIINVTGEGTELRTQQITLGAGTSGLASAPSPSTDARFESVGSDSLYWYPAYMYDEDTYQQLRADSGDKMGYGTINISDGAKMIVGEGNTNNTNNRLQIFNGEVNISGENSALILSDGVHLSLDSNYGYSVSNVHSTINISNGATVKSADGVSMRTFSMGMLYNGNEAYAALNVTGEGSLLDLSASNLVTIGSEVNNAGGIGQSTIAVSDKAEARIASATNIQMAVLNSEQYKVDISPLLVDSWIYRLPKQCM